MTVRLDKVKSITLDLSDTLLDLKLLVTILPGLPENVGSVRKSRFLDESEMFFLNGFVVQMYLEKLEQITENLDTLVEQLKAQLKIE